MEPHHTLQYKQIERKLPEEEQSGGWEEREAEYEDERPHGCSITGSSCSACCFISSQLSSGDGGDVESAASWPVLTTVRINYKTQTMVIFNITGTRHGILS